MGTTDAYFWIDVPAEETWRFLLERFTLQSIRSINVVHSPVSISVHAVPQRRVLFKDWCLVIVSGLFITIQSGWVKNISLCKYTVTHHLWCALGRLIDQKILAEKRINMVTFQWLSMEKHASMLTSQTLTLCLELHVIHCGKRHAF